MKLAAVATAAGVAYALGWLTRQPQLTAARREASTDALTGLLNRHGLTQQLQLYRGRPYTLYLIDLNGFKPINDTFGHRAGDQLLARLGRRLAEQLPGRLVARIGGDEFVVLGAGRPSITVVATLRQVIAAPTMLPGSPEPVSLTAALGIAYTCVNTDPRGVLHAADLAMYRSKRSGEPCYADPVIDGDSRRPHLVSVSLDACSLLHD